MLLPQLSAYTLLESSSEGGLNPLGLSVTAERMAQFLVPGFRERMLHPRYLTAIAAGAHLCSNFETDFVGKDGVSPPWQVWEWMVVQSLVQTYSQSDINNLPGIFKARRAQPNLPLNRDRYLKTASVFGFHGVYRTLSEKVGLTSEGRLAAGGEKVLLAWEREQKLNGFLFGDGPGRELRKNWTSLIGEAISKGEVARGWNWNRGGELAGFFLPSKAGLSEKQALFNVIQADGSEHKHVMIEMLHRFPAEPDSSDPEFHDFILNEAQPLLHPFIKAIQSYEEFAVLLQNSFEAILFRLSEARRPLTLTELSGDITLQRSAGKISKTLQKSIELIECFRPYVPISLDTDFSLFLETQKPIDYTASILQHHFKIQNDKPPDGKMAWVLENNKGEYVFRSLYMRSDYPDTKMRYVNPYRYKPLSRFLHYLKNSE